MLNDITLMRIGGAAATAGGEVESGVSAAAHTMMADTIVVRFMRRR
jgi:hypothetical protein